MSDGESKIGMNLPGFIDPSIFDFMVKILKILSSKILSSLKVNAAVAKTAPQLKDMVERMFSLVDPVELSTRINNETMSEKAMGLPRSRIRVFEIPSLEDVGHYRATKSLRKFKYFIRNEYYETLPHSPLKNIHDSQGTSVDLISVDGHGIPNRLPDGQIPPESILGGTSGIVAPHSSTSPNTLGVTRSSWMTAGDGADIAKIYFSDKEKAMMAAEDNRNRGNDNIHQSSRGPSKLSNSLAKSKSTSPSKASNSPRGYPSRRGSSKKMKEASHQGEVQKKLQPNQDPNSRSFGLLPLQVAPKLAGKGGSATKRGGKAAGSATKRGGGNTVGNTLTINTSNLSPAKTAYAHPSHSDIAEAAAAATPQKVQQPGSPNQFSKPLLHMPAGVMQPAGVNMQHSFSTTILPQGGANLRRLAETKPTGLHPVNTSTSKPNISVTPAGQKKLDFSPAKRQGGQIQHGAARRGESQEGKRLGAQMQSGVLKVNFAGVGKQ
jgi:hypothetical protein